MYYTCTNFLQYVFENMLYTSILNIQGSPLYFHIVNTFELCKTCYRSMTYYYLNEGTFQRTLIMKSAHFIYIFQHVSEISTKHQYFILSISFHFTYNKLPYLTITNISNHPYTPELPVMSRSLHIYSNCFHIKKIAFIFELKSPPV